jgi:hypothetical protein
VGKQAFQADELAERVVASVEDVGVSQTRREVTGMFKHRPQGVFEAAHETVWWQSSDWVQEIG